MKSKIIMVGVSTAVLVVGLWLGSALPSRADAAANQVSATNQPGSVNDPVVTKSYLDAKVQALVHQQLQQQSQELLTQIKADAAAAGSKLTVIQLKPGNTAFAGAGSEFIVRTGEVVAVSTDSNGIPDLTAGADIKAGKNISLNHLLMFPRSGRGVKAVAGQKSQVYIMVRGSYSIFDKQGKPVSS